VAAADRVVEVLGEGMLHHQASIEPAEMSRAPPCCLSERGPRDPPGADTSTEAGPCPISPGQNRISARSGIAQPVYCATWLAVTDWNKASQGRIRHRANSRRDAGPRRKDAQRAELPLSARSIARAISVGST
jgi:hypothetical protein